MTSRQPPAFHAQGRVPFWRRTPPSVFPPLMGLFGLALAWERAAEPLGVPRAVSEMLLGAVVMLFLFALAAYLAKLAKRPAVIVEDLRILPGRAGLAAGPMCIMVVSPGLVPHAPALGRWLLFGGLVAHGGLAVRVVHGLLTGPVEARQVTPVWHLSFVGFIVAPLSAAPLGFTGLAQAVLAGTAAAAALIYGVSLAQLIRRNPPPPLRPLLAIHVSPLALCGTASLLLGLTGFAVVFAGLASLVVAMLLLNARYLTAAGFSPLWGAFTFPLAAYAGLMLGLAGHGAIFGAVGGLGLVAGTVLIPWIAARILQMWARGALAAKTNAAQA